jgi:hypothetical protein
MGGGSGNTKTTTTTEPPAFIRPYLQYGAQQARALYQTGGPEYYQGNTVVPFSNQTEQALGMTEQRALDGSPVVGAAQDYAVNTLGQAPTSQFGAGANPYGGASNPRLDATFNKAADSVQQRLGTQFAGSGRNTEASRAVNADELNNLATGLYGGAYENERSRQYGYDMSERDRMAQDIEQQRSRQFGVAGLAPTLANQDYVDLQALQGVGGQVEDLTSRLMEDQAARWDFSQNAPQTNLDNYIARVTGGYPGSTATQTTPTYRNRTAGAAGGAIAGAQMGSAFGPWGTGIGAVAGGLLGGWG